MWNCDNCGTTGILVEEFCPHCFAPRTVAPAAPDPTPTPDAADDASAISATAATTGKGKGGQDA